MARPQGRWDGALYSRPDVRAILEGLLDHDGPVTSLTYARFLREAGLPCDRKAIWRATVVLEDAGLLAPDVKWDWEILRPLQATLARRGRRRPGLIIEWWRRRFPDSPWYPGLPSPRRRKAQDSQDLPGAVLGGKGEGGMASGEVNGAGPRRRGARVWRSRALTAGGRGIRRTRKDVGPSGAIRRSPAWLVAPAKAWGRRVLWWRGLIQVIVAVLPPELPPGRRDHPASEAYSGRAWVARLAAFDEALRGLRVTLREADSAEAVEKAVQAWLDDAPEDLPMRAAYRAWPPFPKDRVEVIAAPPWTGLVPAGRDGPLS